MSESHKRLIIGICALFLIGLFLIIVWYRSTNSPSKSPAIPAQIQRRILIIAPHPDDESLGTGGLISEAVSRGDHVKVIFMTNGDGTHYGVQKFTGHRLVRPDDYLYYGRQRQKEAIQALNRLGVNNKDITFFGFPDQGLARIWRDYWNLQQPYTSNQTRKAYVPYQLAIAPGESYTAPSEANLLVKIFKEYKPTAVYVTGTYDCHPDHWASGALTLLSVCKVMYNDASFSPHLYTFDIHLPNRKVTNSDKALLPPIYFLENGDKCHLIPVAKQALDHKKQALANYKTQIMIMPAFFKSMERRSHEIFYLNQIKQIANIDHEIDLTSADDWPADSLIAFNPVTKKQHKTGSILKAVYLMKDGHNLNLRLTTPRNWTDQDTYLINIYLPTSTEQMVERFSLKIIPQARKYQWLIKPSINVPVHLNYQKNKVDIKIVNLFLPNEKYLLLNVDSNINGEIIDRLPWDRFILSE